MVELFFKMNERPATYNSPYNNFYPEDLKDMTDLAKRMVAGAIVDDMARAQIKTLKENNPDNYLIQGASWISYSGNRCFWRRP